MNFETWFEENYGEAMKGQPGAFGAAFKEIAKAAWEAGREDAFAEEAAYRGEDG